jgi:hypothetical protein
LQPSVFSIIVLFTGTKGFSQTAVVESFIAKYPVPGGYDDLLNDVVYDAADESYVYAGSVRDFSTSTPPARKDVYVVKTDREGNLIWSKTFGGIHDDEAFAIETTHDGGYVILGHTRSPAYVTTGTAGLDPWFYDMMLTKLDASGNHVWPKVFGVTGDNYNQECKIMRTSDNGFVIVRQSAKNSSDPKDVIHFHKFDASGNILATKELEPTTTNTNGAYAITQTSDGGFAIAGHADFDFYVAKLNDDFTYDWSIKWNGGVDDHLQAIVENAPGDYSVFGDSWNLRPAGSLPIMYAMRFAFDGTGSPSVSWVETIGLGGPTDNLLERCFGAVSSGDGGCVMVGNTDVNGGGDDSYTVKLDGSGNIVWETIIEGGTSWSDNRESRGIVMDPYGGFAIGGEDFDGPGMIHISSVGFHCEATPHTGIVTSLSTPTFTDLNSSTYYATPTLSINSVSRTPT